VCFYNAAEQSTTSGHGTTSMTVLLNSN